MLFQWQYRFLFAVAVQQMVHRMVAARMDQARAIQRIGGESTGAMAHDRRKGLLRLGDIDQHRPSRLGCHEVEKQLPRIDAPLSRQFQHTHPVAARRMIHCRYRDVLPSAQAHQAIPADRMLHLVSDGLPYLRFREP